jgi:type IV pilus assembly protein PilB
MGIEPFLVSSAIDCVVAQRLARTLCPHCKKRTIISAEVLRDHGFHAQYDIEAYEPTGCVRCSGTGYRGRIGLFEVMVMSEELRSLPLIRSRSSRPARGCADSGRTGSTRSNLDRRRWPRSPASRDLAEMPIRGSYGV